MLALLRQSWAMRASDPSIADLGQVRLDRFGRKSADFEASAVALVLAWE